jgi:tetratricopeptide (TPR) repeat protein
MADKIQNDVTGELLEGKRVPSGIDRSFWYGLLFLSMVTLLAYSSVLPAGFIWDDDAYVIENMQLRTAEGLARIWLEPGATPQYYPMVFTLFWAQFQLWGLNPVGYHLVNILLHILNAVLLWSCLRRLDAPAPFWIASIFALHPVQVESVAWITELKNVLSTFFYLLALHAYLKFSGLCNKETPERKAFLFYAVSLGCFLLALFSKTVSGSLPAAMLLIIWWQKGRVAWREIWKLLPFFALAMFLGGQTARLEVSHVLAKGPEWDFSLLERLLIAGRAVWFYAGKLIWPHPLIFNYPRWQIDAGEWWQYLFPLAFMGLLFLLWYLRERIGRGTLVAVLFFCGTLFPALGFFNVYPMRYSFVADHFQYAASIGLIALFCGSTQMVFARLPGRLRQAQRLFFVVIVVLLATLTWNQGHAYRDRFTLFSDTIAKNPSSWLSYSNRGRDYALAGRDALALEDLERSLALNPNDADALQCRGIIRLKRKEYDRALADLDKSIAIQPWRSDYFRNRSIANRVAGRLDLAIADADSVIRLAPESVEAYLERGALYAMGGNNEKALEDLNRALELDPASFQGLSNRGLIHYRSGRQVKAISDFRRALELNPDSAETYFNRGLAHAAAGDAGQAMSDLQHARALGYDVTEEELKRILLTVKKSPVETQIKHN